MFNFINGLLLAATGTVSEGMLTISTGEGGESVSIPVFTDYISIGLRVISAMLLVGAIIVGVRYLWTGVVKPWLNRSGK